MTMQLEAPARPGTNGHVEAPGKMLRAAIYCRVSTRGQEERGYSLDGQLAECRGLAELLSAEVVAEWREQQSGADWDRPQLLECLAAAKAGAFDMLLLYDTSRLARDVGLLLYVERQLGKAGVQIRYVRESFDDSPSGQFQKQIKGAVDAYLRADLAMRFGLGKRQKVTSGRVLGAGPVPYGWSRQTDPATGRTTGYAIQEPEASTVRRIYRLAQHQSLARIARQLEAEQVPSPGGGARWAPSSIDKILHSPIYHGDYRYGRRRFQRDGRRVKVIARPEDDHLRIELPAIVPPEDVRHVHELLTSRQHRRGRSHAAVDPDAFLLRGLLQCSRCGGQIGVSNNHGIRYYYCGRSHPARARLQGRAVCDLPPMLNAQALEAATWKTVSERLLDADYLRAGFQELRQRSSATVQAERIAFLTSEIASERARLDTITERWLSVEPGSELERSLRAKADACSERIRSMQRDLDRFTAAQDSADTEQLIASVTELASKVRHGAGKATPQDRRRIYELLQLRGTVAPDPGGEPIGKHRVRLAWTALIDLQHSEPSIFMLRSSARGGLSVTEQVAQAVYEAAYDSGVARRERRAEYSGQGA